jgi:paraquat-inducible protein B
MTDPVTPDETPPTPATVDEAPPQRDMPPPAAHLRQRRFSFVWIIPLVAAAIALYLGYRTIIQQGPLVTISFNNGEGLAEGQTQVKYKAVALGTVESIDLSPDNSHVNVRVRMNGVGTRFLTDHARFWVVRPRISASSFSGLDTLVSGAYIEVDPGPKGGRYKAKFAGLAEPPGIRSDEPGHTYVLRAESIGSLSSGSPVFYRDVVVGEVLGYDLGDGLGPVPINVFVRAPYDRLVRPASHFWNSSGISAGIEGGQFHIELQSLQALIAGGVTFDLPHDAENTPPSPNNATFQLYPSREDAESAGYENQIAAVSYFTDSVAGLARGAPVQLFGLQVGTVSEVRLMLDPDTGKAQVRVAMKLQPERVFDLKTFSKSLKPVTILQKMVNNGLRAELDTASFITGQKVISLSFVPKAGPAAITMEGDAMVLPSMGGGLEGIMASASQLMARLNAIPFTQIGNNLNSLLVTANGTIGGAKVQGALTSLSETLQSVQHLVAKTDQGLTPVIRQLPALMANLQGTLRGANVAVTGLARGYGNDSDFQRSLAQLMDQADGALRSVKELATFLDRHPEALILGRTGHATGGQ